MPEASQGPKDFARARARLRHRQPNALYWLVAVIIGLLMSAARRSWDLLVKVGDERRTAEAAG
jgi:hypothetical protein